MTGQIIIVNGTSGSGKSTTCELFSKTDNDLWLVYGIDHFMGSTFPRKFGHGGELAHEGIYAYPQNESQPDGNLRWGINEKGLLGFSVFHEWLATTARLGCNIIVDHLLISDPPLLQDCVKRLRGLPVLLVTLKPPYDVLMARVDGRNIGNRFSNSNYTSEQALQSKQRLSRLRPWFYQAIYENSVCDLEINSVDNDPEAVVQLIRDRLAKGPGTAMAELASQFGIE